MSDEYEQEDFERLSQDGGQNAREDDYQDDNTTLDGHKLRFSIDIHSIKDPSFKGLIYAKHGALSSLGTKEQPIHGVITNFYRHQAIYDCSSNTGHQDKC